MTTVIVAGLRIVGSPNPGALWLLASLVVAGIVLGVTTGAAMLRRLSEPSSASSKPRRPPDD
jgi:hypothetical protein